MASIPVVDFRDFHDPAKREAFIRTLGEGLEAFGFVAVTGHGVDEDLLDRAYATAERTFALPSEVKRQYEDPANARQRGYTAFGVEHAKDQPIGDLKEFWHVGRELDADHPLARSGDIPVNHFPAEEPAFQGTFLELFDALEYFAHSLLAAVGEYLELPEGFFKEMVHDGNSVLRIIHYPDVPDAEPGAVRAAQHEDINLMTVLPASTRPGLELLTREGKWMAVQTPPGVMVCDTGDMMQLLTGGRLPATTHRVVNPDNADGGRYSMPFFVHPHPDRRLTTLGSDEQGPTTRDFLLQRLRENGVAN
ncbi:MAG: isopenicillin N synthase family oxygenase [Deltaproteobacteria bacterium]|nr:MAG: isopenicillin N synthase family oxygenase [Deltaproteobacteria bacterium]